MLNIKSIPPKAIPIILASLVCIGLVLFFINDQHDEPISKERFFPIETYPVKLGSHRGNLMTLGAIEAGELTKIASPVNAYVLKKYVSEGDEVKKETVLLELDPADLNIALKDNGASIKALEASLKAAITQQTLIESSLVEEAKLLALRERGVKRQAYLKKRKLGSDENYDTAEQLQTSQKISFLNLKAQRDSIIHEIDGIKANLEQLQAQRDRIKLDLARSTMRAPFDARITKVMPSIGDRLNQGESAIELYDINSLEVRTQIPDKYVRHFRHYMREKMLIQAKTIYLDQSIDLTFFRLSADTSATRGGVDAIFNFVTMPLDIQLGDLVKLKIYQPAEQNSFVVPQSGLHKDHIYVIREHRLYPVGIEVLGSITRDNNQKDFIVRSAHVKDGDLICTTRLSNIRPGLLVQVKEPK